MFSSTRLKIQAFHFLERLPRRSLSLTDMLGARVPHHKSCAFALKTHWGVGKNAKKNVVLALVCHSYTMSTGDDQQISHMNHPAIPSEKSIDSNATAAFFGFYTLILGIAPFCSTNCSHPHGERSPFYTSSPTGQYCFPSNVSSNLASKATSCSAMDRYPHFRQASL